IDDYERFLDSFTSPQLPCHPLDYVLGHVPLEPGLILECGVFEGASITKIAKRYPDRTVFGFDSFEGLPEDWVRAHDYYPKGFFGTNGELPAVPSNVRLVKGWFADTLPKFREDNEGRKISLLHVDCDLYSSTKCIFDHLGPLFQGGMILVFDELVNYPGFED